MLYNLSLSKKCANVHSGRKVLFYWYEGDNKMIFGNEFSFIVSVGDQNTDMRMKIADKQLIRVENNWSEKSVLLRKAGDMASIHAGWVAKISKQV